MTTKPSSIVLAIIMLASLAFSLYAATLPEGPLMMRFFIRDDAFYYFKVAQNISEGFGATFDRIAPTNGFHPLWMLLCIPFFALARINLILPFRLLLVFLGILNLATIWLIFQSLRRLASEQAGLVGACLWAFSFPIQVLVSRMGLETGLTSFTIALLVYVSIKAESEGRWDIKRYLGFSLVAILLLLSRLDSIFLVIFFGLWLVFRKTNLRHLLIVDLTATALAVSLAFYLRLGMLGTDAYTVTFRPAAFVMVILAVILHPLANLVFGLYRQFPISAKQLRPTLVRILLSTLIGSVALAVAMFALQAIGYFPTFSRTIPLFEFVLSLLLIMAGRGLLQLAAGLRLSREQKLTLPFWKTHFARGLAYFGPVIVILAAYMGVNKLYAGTPMPVSGQIKAWWAELTYTVYGRVPTTLSEFLDQFLEIWTPISQSIYRPAAEKLAASGSSAWLAIAPALLLAILAMMLIALGKRKAEVKISLGVLVPLLAGSLIQFIYYDASGYVASKEWYWISQMIFLVFLFGSASELLAFILKSERRRVVLQAALGLGGVMLFTFFAWEFVRDITFAAVPANIYREEAAFIEANTPPGALIGMTGGGTAAYFITDRTIINLDGLINGSEYFTALEENQAGTYLQEIGLGYVYGNEYMLTESIPYRYIFQGKVQKIEQTPIGLLYRFTPANP